MVSSVPEEYVRRRKAIQGKIDFAACPAKLILLQAAKSHTNLCGANLCGAV
jgi:hypothetical protein